jgi:hypothetical protein
MRRLSLVALLVLVGLGSLVGSATRGRARAGVDPGKGWEPATTLYSASGAEFARVSSPTVALDGRRRATAVWLYDSEHVLMESDWTESAGWTPAKTLTSLGNEVFSSPLLAVDARGDALIAWITNDEKLRAAYRPAGGGWQPPKTLSRPGDSVAFPQVGLDDRGRSLVLWNSSRRSSGGYRFRLEVASRTRTGVWSKPKIICACGGVAALAVNASGQALVVWSPNGAGLWAKTRSRSGRWFVAERISSLGTGFYYMPLALNSRGDAVVSWVEVGKAEARLAVAIRGPRGRFRSPQTIGGDFYWGFRLALAPTGEATVMWENAGCCLFSMSRLPGASSFTSQQTLARGFGETVPEALAMDAGGNTLALWLRADSPYGTGHLYLHAAQRPAVGSFDNGADIGGIGLDSYKHSACSGEPSLAVTPNGRLALAVWLTRPRPTGACTAVEAAALMR